MSRATLTNLRPLTIITLRREVAARYALQTRQWQAARSTFRRLSAGKLANIAALRTVAARIDRLDRGRAALLSDLKALAL